MIVLSKPINQGFKPFEVVITVQTEREAIFLKQLFGNMTNKNIIDIANNNSNGYTHYQEFDVNTDGEMFNELTHIYTTIKL